MHPALRLSSGPSLNAAWSAPEVGSTLARFALTRAFERGGPRLARRRLTDGAPVTFATSTELADTLRLVATHRDRAAFEAVYRATSAKLYGVVLRIVPQRALADEIMQDVYLRIWDKAADFDVAKGSPITWMTTIARNRALDEVRRKPIASLDSDDSLLDVVDDTTEQPLASRERSEDLRRLMVCLGGLDAEKRQLILLAYYRGASRESLSRRFSAPVATVKTWLHRSLAQLRKCLDR